MVRLDLLLLLLLASGVGIVRVASSAPQAGSGAVPVAVPSETAPIAAEQATHTEMPTAGPALLDEDDDGDNIPTKEENDADKDGVPDEPLPDVDGDGVPDYLEGRSQGGSDVGAAHIVRRWKKAQREGGWVGGDAITAVLQRPPVIRPRGP